MIELSEMIENLRSELSEAQEAGRNSSLRFEVEDVELELSVVVGREAGGSGKVKFWVVEVGAEAGVSSTTAQRMTLRLRPTSADGSTPLISGRSATGER